MAGSKVQGTVSLKRVLRRLPDASRSELANALVTIGQRLLSRAKAEAPTRTGGLRAALNVRVAVKTLQLRLGLATKAVQRKYFYGYILDAGRKSKTVTAKRRKSDGTVSTYAMRVKGISPRRYDFVFGRGRDLRRDEIPELRGVLDRVLSRAARGE